MHTVTAAKALNSVHPNASYMCEACSLAAGIYMSPSTAKQQKQPSASTAQDYMEARNFLPQPTLGVQY